MKSKNSIETLENRRMFAGDPSAPDIESVRFNYDAPRPSITIDFTEHVNTQYLPTAVHLEAKNQHMRINPQNIFLADYNNETDVATLEFRNMLEAGNLYDSYYRLTIYDTVVQDDDGNYLQEDEYRLDFHSMIGDANRDVRIDLGDFAILAANFNSDGRVFSEGDFNYDGRADIADFAFLAGRFGNGLVEPRPAPAADPKVFADKHIADDVL